METQIYIAKTDCFKDEKLFKKYYDLMPKYRQDKINRYLFEEDKCLSLGVGVLLRLALKNCGVNVENEDVVFKVNQKPFLKNNKKIFYNLSHSHNVVMCIVSDVEVGCDVEKVSKVDLKIAGRYFFNTEYELINSQKEYEKKIDMFFKLWTLKESFMKVTGLGFKLPLNDFCITIENKKINVLQNINKNKYYFSSFDFNDGYKYACCSTKNDFSNVNIVDLSSQDVFEKIL